MSVDRHLKVSVQDLGAGLLGLEDSIERALQTGELHGLPVWNQLPDSAPTEDRWSVAQRTALAQSIRSGLAALAPPQAVQDSLTQLETPGTFAVITGQQPGFLCGPLYSLIKAAQCVRLAHALSERWQTPVVPLFWNHADDHDVAEVHHSYIQNRNLDLQKVSLAGLSSGRQPLSRIALETETHGLDTIAALLQQNFGMYECAEEARNLLMPRSGETLPRAMTRAFTELLGSQGLVVVEPDWIRAPLSEALAGLLEQDPRAALREGAAHGSIQAETAALLYRVPREGRIAWRMHADGWVEDGSDAVCGSQELADRVRAHPDEWTPGALLRPLVQDGALPCAAYIGGFGELRYHGQLMPARRATGLPVTGFVPRVSMTWVDTEALASLQKTGLRAQEVLAGGGELPVPASESASPEVLETIRTIVIDAQNALRAQRRALAEIEPSLDTGLRRAADQMGQGIEKLLAKAERIHQNKGGKVARHLRRLNHRLMPRGLPQERVLGPMEFLARYGTRWATRLLEVTPPLAATHLLMTLEDEAS